MYVEFSRIGNQTAGGHQGRSFDISVIKIENEGGAE